METPPLDIFATKGAEYIFVVGFLLALIFFWRILYPPKKSAASLLGNRRSSQKRAKIIFGRRARRAIRAILHRIIKMIRRERLHLSRAVA